MRTKTAPRMRPFPGRGNPGYIRGTRSGTTAHPGQRDVPGLRGSHHKARGRGPSHASGPGTTPPDREGPYNTRQRDRSVSTGRHRRPPLSGNASRQRQAGRSGQEGIYPTIWKITPSAARLSSETLRPGSENSRRPGSSQSACVRVTMHQGRASRAGKSGQICDMSPGDRDHPGRKVTPETEGPQAFFHPNDPNKPRTPNASNITSGPNPKNQTRDRTGSNWRHWRPRCAP